MKLEVVVLPAGGTNVATVEVRTDKGHVLAQLEVRDILDNITVKTTVINSDYTFRRHLTEYEQK